MRATRYCTGLVLIMTIFVSFASAQDHNYAPLEPGNELWYENTGDATLAAHIFFEAGPAGTSIFNAEHLVNGEVVNAIRGHFSGNQDGDVFWLGPEIAGDLIPFSSTYVMIDAPLFTGKSWSFETSHPIFGDIEFAAEVLAEDWLAVPGVGNLYCFHVHYEEVWENFGPRSADRWFADGFGEVQFIDPFSSPDPYLVTAAIVIPVEEQTWSSVKSMYR